MGYDITFHPVSREEIKFFIFDVLNDPSLVQSRVSALSKDDDYVDYLNKYYEFFLEKFSEKQHIRIHEVSFFIGIVSSFLHPYWYVRNSCISFLVMNNKVNANIFSSIIHENSGQKIKKIREKTLLIEENYSGSGYIENHIAEKIVQIVSPKISPPEQNSSPAQAETKLKSPWWPATVFNRMIARIKEMIGQQSKEIPIKKDDVVIFMDEVDSGLVDNIDKDFIDALNQLQEYCTKNKLGFIEVADGVCPMFGDNNLYPENMNASFLKKDNKSS